MPHFHIDHNVSAELADSLRAAGHLAATAAELAMTRGRDDQHLLFATQSGRILITHNWKDFRLLHNAWHEWSAAWDFRREHVGILVMSQATVAQLMAALHTLLESDQPLADRLYRWTPGSGWQHFPQ